MAFHMQTPVAHQRRPRTNTPRLALTHTPAVQLPGSRPAWQSTKSHSHRLASPAHTLGHQLDGPHRQACVLVDTLDDLHSDSMQYQVGPSNPTCGTFARPSHPTCGNRVTIKQSQPMGLSRGAGASAAPARRSTTTAAGQRTPRNTCHPVRMPLQQQIPSCLCGASRANMSA